MAMPYSISGGDTISIWPSPFVALTKLTRIRRERFTRCLKFQLASTGTPASTAAAT